MDFHEIVDPLEKQKIVREIRVNFLALGHLMAKNLLDLCV